MNRGTKQTGAAAPAVVGLSDEVRQQGLAEAFAAFNRLSEELAGSYRELELKVEQLSTELAAARSQRLQELAEKERLANRLGRLLESLPGAVVVTDGAGVVREANPAALEFLGDPLLGVAWSSVALRFEQGASHGSEVSLPGGRRLSISMRELGSEPGHILLLQDVTEASGLREELDRHRRLSTMGEMAAGLAHQVRTPLSSVLLYLSHLEQRGLEPEQRSRLIERIRGRIRHLERLVTEMLQFARGQSPALMPLKLSALLEGFHEMARPLVDEAKGVLEMKQDQSSTPVWMAAQREALLGAMLNLVSNAIHASGQGVHITLQIGRDADGNLAMTFSDKGPGVPADVADKIFEPFFTTRTQGTGLGLAVVHHVLEAHGGNIRLDRSVTEGASFVLQLPTIDAPVRSDGSGAGK